jgi:uncharacterized membrane protein YoaK (UPF0700 family)
MSRAAEAAAARWPWRGVGQGPLPALLLALTFVTGVVDAVSYLTLGRVFVANMTGNVVFLGFALAGASGLSISASLVAIAAFAAGAAAGGRIGRLRGEHRGRHLAHAAGAGGLALLIATIIAAAAANPPVHDARYLLIVALAIAMGAQNATARRLAVPDLTTTVLTLTLTGVAADSRLGGGSSGRPARRLASVVAMLAGALAGALLVRHASVTWAVALATAIVAAVAIAAALLSARAGEDAGWAAAPAGGA